MWKDVAHVPSLSRTAVSASLIREEGIAQLPVYYVSKAMVQTEMRYPNIEKLSFELVMSSRKLKPYFQAHSITTSTSYPLRQELQKPELSGRLIKWSIELGQYEISYKLRTVIKAQEIVDFIAEFTTLEE